ncbi:unnamed protein product [Debaryomyces tyrocola]|nr:unnamed protein product [Debaryomyces tyrocola]
MTEGHFAFSCARIILKLVK